MCLYGFPQPALPAPASSACPQSTADLSKMTIPKLQGLLLRDDGHRWADHAKLKGKKELVEACMSLYQFPVLLAITAPTAVDAAAPALMPPACLCPHPSVCDE